MALRIDTLAQPVMELPESWDNITVDNVFGPGDTPRGLRRDIGFLTCALSKYKHGESVPAVVSKKDKLAMRKFTLLGHIATLLTIGRAGDRSAATVNAVAGSLEADYVNIVCAVNERPYIPKSKTGTGVPTEPVAPMSDDQGPLGDIARCFRRVQIDEQWATRSRGVLYNATEKYVFQYIFHLYPCDSCRSRSNLYRSVSYEDHLKQVGSIIQHLLSIPHERRRISKEVAVSVGLFNMFFVRRAHWKLAARIDTLLSGKIWEGNPLHRMRVWYSENADSITDGRVVFPQPSPESTLLYQHGIVSESVDLTNRTEYPITPQNIPLWFDVLDDVVKSIRDPLFGNGAISDFKQRPDHPPDRQQTIAILQAIVRLEWLLSSNLFDIFARHGAGQCLERRGLRGDQQLVSLEGFTVRDVEDQKDIDAQATNEAEDEGDDETASIASDTAGGPVAQLQHHFQTITAWCTAISAIVNFKATLRVRLFSYSTSPCSEVVQEDLTSCLAFLTRCQGISSRYLHLLDDLPDSPERVKWVAKARQILGEEHLSDPLAVAIESQLALPMTSAQKRHVQQSLTKSARAAIGLSNRMVIHAEAALMDLALAVGKGLMDQHEDVEILKSIFLPHNNEVAIGVGKKCCKCCALFAALLANHPTDHEPLPKFLLPGTHSVIFSWRVPSVEVPLEVLRSMRAILFSILNGRVYAACSPFHSNQSLPVEESSMLAMMDLATAGVDF
ncbi:hypothetical protein C8Q77DRAFT_1113977 [Trametes polyzona]|nr:hypothetical protein C8Q77DRAFT_1113977 [Trametes polyzona]